MNSNKIWFNKTSLGREEIVMVNHLRSNLNSSLHRVNIVDSPACPCGAEFQDANHVIFCCDLYSHKASHLRCYYRSKFHESSDDIFLALSHPS